MQIRMYLIAYMQCRNSSKYLCKSTDMKLLFPLYLWQKRVYFQFLVAEGCLDFLRDHTAEVFSPKDPFFPKCRG